MSSVGLILLAAGGSGRMGRPKQLLVYQGKTLLRRAADTAAASPCRPIVVVTGAQHSELLPQLEDLDLIVELNDQWKRGMGTSLRAGMRALLARQPDASAAVVMLCDQSHVSPAIVTALVEAQRATAKPAIACAYAGTYGPPCLFAASQFPALLAIPDERGAKALLAAAAKRDDLHLIPFPQGHIDIDTPADFDTLA